MKFLTGTAFGCNFKTLRTIYKALILSTHNYGFEAYHTLSSTAEKQLDTIQTRALCFCLGALQSTPNIVINAESSEIPLTLQRLQGLLIYTSKVYATAHLISQDIITNKFGETTCSYTRNTTYEKMQSFFSQHQQNIPHKFNSNTPPWLMIQPTINTEVSEITSRKANNVVRCTHCEQLINITSNSHVQLFTDASKESDGSVAIAVYNVQDNKYLRLRLSDNTPIYAAELAAIQCAILWLIKKSPNNSRAIIFTDCLAALLE